LLGSTNYRLEDWMHHCSVVIANSFIFSLPSLLLFFLATRAVLQLFEHQNSRKWALLCTGFLLCLLPCYILGFWSNILDMINFAWPFIVPALGAIATIPINTPYSNHNDDILDA
jgi:hypothetical protein